MKRRKVLKNTLFATVGLFTLPAWGNAWNVQSLPNFQQIFTDSQVQNLDILVDTLIPSAAIPGAKDLSISTFVNKMIVDCYEKPIQESFKNGLENADKVALETYKKSLANCDQLQRDELLKTLSVSSDTQQKEFFALLKSLTVLGYTTTEYVQTKHYNYVMAPGHYYGCVSV